MTRQEAETAIRATTFLFGPGYHPDTPFQDYMGHDGEALLPPSMAEIFNEQHREAFSVLGDEVYRIAREEMATKISA